MKMDDAGILHCRKRRVFLYADTLRAGSTDEPASSVAGQRLQHKTLK